MPVIKLIHANAVYKSWLMWTIEGKKEEKEEKKKKIIEIGGRELKDDRVKE